MRRAVTAYLETMEILYMTFLIMYEIRNVYRILKSERLKDKKISGMMQLSTKQ